MNTKSITVQHNYRTSNDDQYARTLIVHNIELEEGENKQDTTLRAIKEMDDIFRLAFPYMQEHLNFYVVKQQSSKWAIPKNDEIKTVLKIPSDAEFHSRNDDLKLPTTIPEKINKGTIEDIEAIKEEMKNFKKSQALFHALYGKYINHPELKELYKEKFKELKPKTSNTVNQ